MAAYRFKVFLEDNEDVFRDIDIKAAQNFEELHTSIQEAFKFDAKHSASFFVSDDYWRKGQEITLRKEDLPLDEEEIRKNVDPKKLMKDVKIAKYIEQPHQRFVYVFDPEAQWTFFLEMIKIVEVNNRVDYPAIVKSVGTPPKQYKTIAVKEDVSPDLAMAALLGDEDLDDEEEDTFKAIDPVEEAVEDEDISTLEGEEGDAEEADAEEEGGSDYASEETEED